MLGCLIAGVMLGPLTADGAVMRVWQVDRQMSALAPLVPGQLPNAWVKVQTIDLDGARGDFGPVDDDFMVLVDAELHVDDPGVYEFRLTSDDGSQLWIGGQRVIDNDGLHGAESKTGSKELTRGSVPMQVKFFERGAQAMLKLEWRPPGEQSFVVIPSTAMRARWPDKRPVEAGVKEIAPRFAAKHDVGPEPKGPHNVLTDRQKSEGWTLLFDGLEAAPWWRGFKKEGLPDEWRVADGVLARHGGGDIVTREEFDNFDLYLDWKVEAGGNSGIFFNGGEDESWIWETAPEMQILDNVGHGDGITALQSAGANYALHPPPVDASRPAGQWNRARILVNGDHVQYWLNGVKTADYVIGSEDWKRRVAGSKFVHMPKYGTLPSGHIGLQDHGDPVQFRNMRIKRLDPASGS